MQKVMKQKINDKGSEDVYVKTHFFEKIKMD